MTISKLQEKSIHIGHIVNIANMYSDLDPDNAISIVL